MPLREDLLEPIAGENPSGANLYYDKVFDQIKEARTEEIEVGSAGAWERAPKKADHPLVIKLASDALATRSKDLRLVGWLIESLFKREGTAVLLPCVDLLGKMQEAFWTTLYPEIEDDGNLDLRISTIEGTVNRLAVLMRNAPITKAGYGQVRYTESRRVGYEEAADTSEKQEARKDAIEQGRLAPEEFDTSFAATPKSFYAATADSLEAARTSLDQLDAFHQDKYGDDYPSLNKLVTAIEEVKQVVVSLLNEKRKLEPDVFEVMPDLEPEPEAVVEVAPPPVAAAVSVPGERGSVAVAEQPAYVSAPVLSRVAAAEVVSSGDQARTAVLNGALYLFEEDPQSPLAYLVCAGLRLAETRQQGASPATDFAIAPSTETRQSLRRLATEGDWDELMKRCLTTMADPCGRAWLDLQRYAWRAANEMGAASTAAAVVSTVAGLLKDLPEIRGWMLDDDTPVGNVETQAWIDAEVLPPAPMVEAVAEMPEPFLPLPPVSSTSNGHGGGEPAEPEIYETAVAMLNRGKAREAITMLVRDAELQPSGRRRFRRRVQVAELCLAAEQDSIAYPVLMELSQEMERRGLETWESGEMLGQPLSLLLTCLERRNGAAEQKESVFERLCRLDPQAAFGAKL